MLPLSLLGCSHTRRPIRYNIYIVGGGGGMGGSSGAAKGGNAISGASVSFDIYQYIGDTITYWIGDGGRGGEHRIAYNVTTLGGVGGAGFPTGDWGEESGGKGGDGWSGSSGGGCGGGGGGGTTGLMFRRSDGSTIGRVCCGGGSGGGGATLNNTDQPMNGGDGSYAIGGTTDSHMSTGGNGAGGLSGGGGGGQGVKSDTNAAERGGLGGTAGTGWGGVASTGGRRGGWVNTLPPELILPWTGGSLNISGDNIGQRLGEGGYDYYPNYTTWPTRGVDGKAGGFFVRNTESGQRWVIDTAGGWRTFTFQ